MPVQHWVLSIVLNAYNSCISKIAHQMKSPFISFLLLVASSSVYACDLTIGEMQAWPEENSWVVEGTGFTATSNVLWFSEAGEIIAEGPVLDYVGSAATVCAMDAGCEAEEWVCATLEPAAPARGVSLSAELLNCSAFQVYADLSIPPTGNFEWTVDGASSAFSGDVFALPVADEPAIPHDDLALLGARWPVSNAASCSFLPISSSFATSNTSSSSPSTFNTFKY